MRIGRSRLVVRVRFEDRVVVAPVAEPADTVVVVAYASNLADTVGRCWSRDLVAALPRHRSAPATDGSRL